MSRREGPRTRRCKKLGRELTVLHELRHADEQAQAHERHQDHGILEDTEDGDYKKKKRSRVGSVKIEHTKQSEAKQVVSFPGFLLLVGMGRSCS